MTARNPSAWPDDRSHVRSTRKPTMPRWGVYWKRVVGGRVVTDPIWAVDAVDSGEALYIASKVSGRPRSELDAKEIRK